MIAFQGFVPQQLQPPGFLADGKCAQISQGVQALNVETVLLPNVTATGEETPGAQFVTTGMTTWRQFVRVWYTCE